MSKPQRRKDNTRGASSSQAAGLLGAGEFIGFDIGVTNVFEVADSEFVGLDGEASIILKKLSKKDPQTREKALRELVEYVNTKDSVEIESTFTYFSTAFPKMSLDGSVTVRQLSLKNMMLFINKMKKSAEKQLKKLVPYILIATCDISGIVGSQADELLKTCFPDGKSEKVVQIFAEETANVCLEMISQSHLLFMAQRYDEEETTIQREGRITSETLNLLSKLVEKSPKASEIGVKLFENTAQMKKYLANGQPLQVQTGLLNLAQKMPASCKLAESQIVKFALENLDNPEATIGTAAFNLFTFLVSQQKEHFFETFDAKKHLSARLLSIVRKKHIHWKYCGPFLLPSLGAIFEQLPEEEAPLYALNFLVSFADNMPFTITSVPLTSWSAAFAECFKFLVSKIASIGGSTTEQLIPIFNNTINKADLSLDAVQYDFVYLVQWFCEKKLLPKPQFVSFLNHLESNLTSKRPQTDELITKMFYLGRDELCTFHCDALKKDDVALSFICTLAGVRLDYFKKVINEVDIMKILSKEIRPFSKQDHEYLSVVVLRLFENMETKPADIREDFLLSILALMNTTVAKIELGDFMTRLNLNMNNPQVFMRLLTATNGKCARLFDEIFQIFEEKTRLEILKMVLEQGSHNSVDFISRTLESIEWDELSAENISNWLLVQYFDPENPDYTKLLSVFKDFPPLIESVEEYLPSCFSSMPTAYESTAEPPLMDRVLLLERALPEIAKSLLVSESFLNHILKEADNAFVVREMSSLQPYMVTFTPAHSDKPFRYSTLNNRLLDVPDAEAIFFMDRIILSIPYYISLLHTLADRKDKNLTNGMEYTIALLMILEAYYFLVKESEVLDFDQEDLSDYSRLIGLIDQMMSNEMVERLCGEVDIYSDEPNLFEKAFTLLTTDSALKYATAFLTIQHMSQCRKEFCANPLSITPDVPMSVYWAMRMHPPSRLGMDMNQKFLIQYYTETEEIPLNFITAVQEFSVQDPYWQEDVRIFDVRAEQELVWELNIAILQAATSAMRDHFAILGPELLDWILCGQVAAFESVDVIVTNQRPKTIRSEAFIGNLLLLYRQCCETRERVGEIAFSDWEDFYSPHITQIFLRIWDARHLSPQSATTLATKEICRIVSKFEDVPPIVALLGDQSTRFIPNEQNFLLVSRCMQGLQSGNYLDEFSSLNMLKINAENLYRLENGKFEIEEKVSESGPRKLKVNGDLLRVIENKGMNGLPRFGCFHVALWPLLTDELVDEEKILYSEAVTPLVKIVLPELIEYLSSANPNEKHLNNILGSHWDCFLTIIKDMCVTIPAAVRNWYNGLPKNTAQIVQKFFLEYICKDIINEEIRRLKDDSRKSSITGKEFKIKVVPHARQVIAEYLVEDTRMVLTISLAENYPLSVPEIDIEKAIMPSARVKKWLIQITSYLFYQNGTLINGIRKWKQNVDKDIEGAENCSVCLATIHFETHQLPKVMCKQCKNKFHSACLYKWFETSHHTQCPLCRTSFT